MSTTTQCDESIIRRSANYEPSIWGYDYIQSLRNPYVGESYSKRIEKLKGDVRVMLQKAVDLDPLQQLELVDTLQRLGISYHFENEIKEILNNIYNNYEQKQESLYAVALHFRLLRQHGYHIPADVFGNFRDETGNFNSCLGDDCKGILSLYEAAHLLVEGENDIFHETVNFTTKYLKQCALEHNNNDEYLSSLVNHSLEIPLHWRVLRLEARWFIGLYETATDMNPVLLEFAKLDFNSVQATHQEDLKYASRWWKESGLEKADFARNRVVQNFLWSVGIIFEPQFGYCRRMSTKSYLFITVIDDLYDVYATVDELELFTDAVDRWDATAIEQLPDYMKHIFRSLYTSINEMASDALKDRGTHIISYLTKGWSTLFNCYLKEAKWFNSGYIPTLQEYMDIAWFSAAGPVMMVHGFAAIANPATKESMEFFEQYYNIIRLCSTILRYANDLGTSTNELARGDIQKSIQIYMHENGVSERDAREYIQNLIAETWLKVNKFQAENPHLSNIYMGFPLNLARMAICMYENGDGHAVENCSKDRVLSLLINPIPCT